MKKLFSVGLMGWLLVSMAACQQTPTPSTEAQDSQITALTEQLTTLEEENAQLEASLATYESVAGNVTFVIDGSNPRVRSVAFEATEDETPLTLLVDAFGESQITYSESEFGVFIERIGAIEPGFGAYILIEKNNEPLTVGLSEASMDDGDVFRFSVDYWDPEALAIRESLALFIDTQAKTFTEEFNYDVLHARALLEDIPDTAYVAAATDEAGALKDLLVLKALGKDITEAVNTYEAVYQTDGLFRASLGMMALKGTDAHARLMDTYMARIKSTNLNDASFDAIAVTVMHLKDDTPSAWVDALKDRIQILDNAPSLAFAIMALIALDENPYDTALESGDSLPETLLRLQALDGGFLYDFNSGPDSTQKFSSPQSFLALSALEAYLNDAPAVPYE